MDIILISGHAESGKSSAATLIKQLIEKNNKSVCIIPYAKYLKFIAKEYFSWDGKKDSKGRDLLISLGTEIVRKRNKNFWVDAVIDFVVVFRDFFDIFIIDDCRYQNEIDRWKEEGIDIITVRIIRKNYINSLTKEQQSHESEVALDCCEFDYVVESESGLDNLNYAILDFLRELEKRNE